MPISYNLNGSQGTLPTKTKSHKFAVAFGAVTGCMTFLFLAAGFLFWWRQRRNRQILFDVDGKRNFHAVRASVQNLVINEEALFLV
jgi:hypothetical protein